MKIKDILEKKARRCAPSVPNETIVELIRRLCDRRIGALAVG